MKRLLLISLIIFSIKAEETTSVQPDADQRVPRVAIIAIESVNNLNDCCIFQKKLILANKQFDGVVLYIDCGGGAPSYFSAISNTIKNMSIPIISYAGNACSGGYMTASATNYIVGDKYAAIGSIGVAYSYPKNNNLLLQIGSYKEAGGKLNKKQIQAIKERVNKDYNSFCNQIAKERNLDIKKSSIWADGKAFDAATAKELGLVDEIGTLDTALNKMKQLLSGKGLDTSNGIELTEVIEDKPIIF